MKKILSLDELIAHMKRKGIRFNLVDETAAREFLADHNYYMKLASYRANYDKCPPESKRAGEYQNLEFAYLQELSTIDMHLRYIVLEMCLDIEHQLKVRLVTDVTNDANEDGYQIVKNFFRDEDINFRILKNINSHKSGEYCKELIDKYYPYFPIWVIVELISFGDLIHIIQYYERTSSNKILLDQKIMNVIRDLRNACAHSNCLLNKMSSKMDSTKQPNSIITNFVAGMNGISAKSRKQHLSCTFPYYMVTLLYVYNHYTLENAKKVRYEQLHDFLEGRALKHKEYFKGNPKICGTYDFLKKVIDNLNQMGYNVSTIENGQ